MKPPLLDCCRPDVYDAKSRAFIHGEGCTGKGAGVRLSGDEWREAVARARAITDHPTNSAPRLPESWTVEHDRLYPYGCGQSACYRCGGIDDDPPYTGDVMYARD